jgi:hypothetical protein
MKAFRIIKRYGQIPFLYYYNGEDAHPTITSLCMNGLGGWVGKGRGGTSNDLL